MTQPTKSKLNFETVGSIAAMVIGASALFVAWDQAQIMRKQQHASVLPIVNIDGGFSSSSDSHTMTISFRNDGIGPALIESARLTIDGSEVADWSDLRDRFLTEGLRSGFHSSLDTAVGVLAAGEVTEAIRFKWPVGQKYDAEFGALKSRVFSPESQRALFSVCYCSVFDRCWRSGDNDGIGAKPTPVKQCDDAGEDVVARILRTLSEETD